MVKKKHIFTVNTKRKEEKYRLCSILSIVCFCEKLCSIINKLDSNRELFVHNVLVLRNRGREKSLIGQTHSYIVDDDRPRTLQKHTNDMFEDIIESF